MRLDDARAGTFGPNDGLADPNGVVMGYIGAASRLGNQSYSNVDVTGIRVTGGKVQGVETSQGFLSTPLVVNAAGPWLAKLGRMAGVEIPLTALRRQMLVTTALPRLPVSMRTSIPNGN
jgi:sarcosine oxidase subunit beta